MKLCSIVLLDVKGSIAGYFYFLLIIGKYLRFHEVAALDSTEFAQVIRHYNWILSTTSIPEQIKTDNRPPFSSQDFDVYSKKSGFHYQPRTPDQSSSDEIHEDAAECSSFSITRAERFKEAVYHYLLA